MPDEDFESGSVFLQEKKAELQAALTGVTDPAKIKAIKANIAAKYKGKVPGSMDILTIQSFKKLYGELLEIKDEVLENFNNSISGAVTTTIPSVNPNTDTPTIPTTPVPPTPPGENNTPVPPSGNGVQQDTVINLSNMSEEEKTDLFDNLMKSTYATPVLLKAFQKEAAKLSNPEKGELINTFISLLKDKGITEEEISKKCGL